MWRWYYGNVPAERETGHPSDDGSNATRRALRWKTLPRQILHRLLEWNRINYPEPVEKVCTYLGILLHSLSNANFTEPQYRERSRLGSH